MNASHLYATPAESAAWNNNNVNNTPSATKRVIREVYANGVTAVKPMVRTASTIMRKAM